MFYNHKFYYKKKYNMNKYNIINGIIEKEPEFVFNGNDIKFICAICNMTYSKFQMYTKLICKKCRNRK